MDCVPVCVLFAYASACLLEILRLYPSQSPSVFLWVVSFGLRPSPPVDLQPTSKRKTPEDSNASNCETKTVKTRESNCDRKTQN